MMIWLLIIPLLPYLLLLIYIYRGLLRAKARKPQIEAGIKVSVIVACRDEEINLPMLLNDLVSQDYPVELYEVIVVDDHSIDNTGTIASSFYINESFRALRNKGIGKKSALRTGIAASKGDIILTTDGDCRLNSRWISSMASFWTEHKPDLIIGPVYHIKRPGLLAKFEELEFLSLQGVTAGTAGAGNPVMCNGANLAFTAETYKKYSDDLHGEIASGDDIFLLHRIKTNNGKILWNGNFDSAVRAESPDSLKRFLRQRARWVSKSGAYEDRFTQFLALITLIASTDVALLLTASFFVSDLFPVFLVAISIKSVPDILILSRITYKYKKTNLLWWFIPSQAIYPFYIIAVSVYSLFRKNKW